MAFDPGRPLPAAERETRDGTLYHGVTADWRIVVLRRQAGRWYWHFVAGHRPDGNGTWADVQRLLNDASAFRQEQPDPPEALPGRATAVTPAEPHARQEAV